MRIFRFELKFSLIKEGFYPVKNVGPFARYQQEYSTGTGYDRLGLMRTPLDHQPEPEEDGLRVLHGWAYGCHSRSELIRFFSMDLGRLHRAGFAVFEYEVPDENIHHGEYQVQYYPGEATLIRMLDIKEFKREAQDEKYHLHIICGKPYSKLGK